MWVPQMNIQMKTFRVEEHFLKLSMICEQTLAGCEQSVKKSRSFKGSFHSQKVNDILVRK